MWSQIECIRTALWQRPAPTGDRRRKRHEDRRSNVTLYEQVRINLASPAGVLVLSARVSLDQLGVVVPGDRAPRTRPTMTGAGVPPHIVPGIRNSFRSCNLSSGESKRPTGRCSTGSSPGTQTGSRRKRTSNGLPCRLGRWSPSSWPSYVGRTTASCPRVGLRTSHDPHVSRSACQCQCQSAYASLLSCGRFLRGRFLPRHRNRATLQFECPDRESFHMRMCAAAPTLTRWAVT